MRTNINKSRVPQVDMFGAEQEQAALVRVGSAMVQNRSEAGMLGYVAAVATNRRVKAGVAQQELLELSGIAQSQMSKMVQVIRAMDAHVNGADKAVEGLPDSKIDTEKIEAHRQNLVKFIGFCRDADETVPQPVALFGGLLGDDGDVRADCLPIIQSLFGAPTGAYRVAIGEVVHPNDPRSREDEPKGDDEDGDEDGDDEDGDDEVTPWQELVQAALVQAKHQGASVTDVLAVVNAAYKS